MYSLKVTRKKNLLCLKDWSVGVDGRLIYSKILDLNIWMWMIMTPLSLSLYLFLCFRKFWSVSLPFSRPLHFSHSISGTVWLISICLPHVTEIVNLSIILAVLSQFWPSSHLQHRLNNTMMHFVYIGGTQCLQTVLLLHV